MSFPSPNQQCQSTEGNTKHKSKPGPGLILSSSSTRLITEETMISLHWISDASTRTLPHLLFNLPRLLKDLQWWTYNDCLGDGGGGDWLVRMEWRPAGWSVSASVNLPLHHKVQQFSSGTGSPVKWLCVCVCVCDCLSQISHRLFVLYHDNQQCQSWRRKPSTTVASATRAQQLLRWTTTSEQCVGQKVGGVLCPFPRRSWVPIQHNVAWAEAYLHTKRYPDPSSHLVTLDMGWKVGWGCCAPYHGGGAGCPSNTMSPGPRPTSVPSGIMIHPTVWPQ